MQNKKVKRISAVNYKNNNQNFIDTQDTNQNNKHQNYEQNKTKNNKNKSQNRYKLAPENKVNIAKQLFNVKNQKDPHKWNHDNNYYHNINYPKTIEILNNGKIEFKSLDKINLKIIEELLNNPDIKSSDISQKLKIPLSTVQRRRGNLEKALVLKKSYEVDLKRFGLRIAEISLHVEDGKTQTVVNELKTQIENKILSTSLRIGNPVINASIMIIFQSSEQLFNLIEKIKKILLFPMWNGLNIWLKIEIINLLQLF